MPIFRTGNIWTTRTDVYSWLAITTNSFIKKDGTLAMGAGIAKEALEKYPDIDKLFGEKIQKLCNPLAFYGVVNVPKYNLFALQTKYHFKDGSTIELIKRSIGKLKVLVSYLVLENIDYAFNNLEIHIPFPGIGYGGLNPKIVYENCLKDLPDNYIIWTKN
jgi:hypothetical protein